MRRRLNYYCAILIYILSIVIVEQSTIIKLSIQHTVPEIEHVNREISKSKVDLKGNHKCIIKIKKTERAVQY